MEKKIEKQFKSDVLKLIDDIFNLITKYCEWKQFIDDKEAVLFRTLIKTIHSFMTKNNITNEDMKNAVKR